MNVDFLEFRSSTEINLNNYFTGGIYKISKALYLERVKDYGYQKLSYTYCFKIKYEGEYIGFLYTKSLELLFEYGLNTLVRIDNNVFYIGNLGLIIKTIVDALGLTKMMISRLDICYDTDTDVLSKFKSFYYNTAIKFKNRNKIKVKGTGKDDDELTIGSLKGRSRCISIYNKTIEINHSHKEYIRNIHRKAFGIKNIYRVELKIMNKTLEIKDIDLMSLGKTEYLESIYDTYFDTLVQFVDVNTNSKIDFILRNNTGKKLNRVVKKKVQGSVKQIKAHINFMDKESKTSELRGNIKGWNQIRSALLKKYELETWYSVKK